MLYLKSKCDYYRHLAGFKTDVDRKDFAKSNLLAYKSTQVAGVTHYCYYNLLAKSNVPSLICFSSILM